MSFPSRIILPDNGKNLLRRELATAFAALGLDVARVDPAEIAGPEHPKGLARHLEAGPVLVLSINFQALERPRPVLETLERAGSRAAVWCVDNPWNILAGVRDPSWKGIPFFVVDKSFIEPLRRAGAEKVFHLPLAACPELFGDPRLPEPADLAPLAFVGRLAFPEKETFFAGIELPSAPAREAELLLQAGGRPDFSWWTERLHGDPALFWPGKKARPAALGAETCNAWLRAASLAAAAEIGAELAGDGPGLDIFGDAPEFLPAGARAHPSVDYYTRLPGIYRKARYSLCCTSLLLPHGLNQRHFDIWMAGGICLTDNTPGLELFPEELTRPTTFTRPEAIPAVVRTLEKMPESARAALIHDRQSFLTAEHTYVHRARTILEMCGA
jgi:hypothetical protein